MKIDIFSHILPQRYKEALYEAAPPGFYLKDVIESLPTLFDLDHRFRIMDKFEGLMQVLTLSSPPVEHIADAKKAAELSSLANDEMAELVMKYPDKFPASRTTKIRQTRHHHLWSRASHLQAEYRWSPLLQSRQSDLFQLHL
ncbi:MAG: hypothetical protein CL876_04565 [Dehalococcoidales bacterium]|nr:hypothetical protein [Dehalococcoidales bacterium]